MAEAILNIGYLIGKSKKRLHTRRIHNAVKKTGVKIIKSEMRKEDPNNKYDEDTRVIKIDRPLTKKEMIELCTSLGQIAIPQMSGETGTLWGPKQVLIDRNYDGGKFNIDYFKLFSSEDAESFEAQTWNIKCDICGEKPIYDTVDSEDYGKEIQVCEECFNDIFTAESFEAEMNCHECGTDIEEDDDDLRNCDLCNVLLCGGCNRRCEGCSNTVCDSHRCSKNCCDGAYCDECHEDEYGAESFEADIRNSYDVSQIVIFSKGDGEGVGYFNENDDVNFVMSDNPQEIEIRITKVNIHAIVNVEEVYEGAQGSLEGRIKNVISGSKNDVSNGDEVLIIFEDKKIFNRFNRSFYDAESFEANWGGMSNMPGHPLNPSRPSDDRGDRLKPRRPIRRPRRRPYNAEVFGQDIDNKVIGIVAIAAIIGGWLFNRGKD